MKNIVVILSFLLINISLSQEKYQTYSWEQAKKLGKDTVYSINFEKLKLDSIPEELFSFPHLKKLNFSKNKLTELPSSFSNLKELEVLNLEKNSFVIFPIEICDLTSLKSLIINRNDFMSLPESFSKLKQLEFLDIWATPIMKFPEAFKELESIKKIDARGISHSKKFQDHWKETMPNVHFIFDTPCNCAD